MPVASWHPKLSNIVLWFNHVEKLEVNKLTNGFVMLHELVNECDGFKKETG